MRIWSLHPKYLDTKGLVALWRETLLAKNVLLGNTKGYRNHPQLIRFKESETPTNAIDYYLQIVWEEAKSRNYNFNPDKFEIVNNIDKLPVSKGQLIFEIQHLINKLKVRDLKKYYEFKQIKSFISHPLFLLVDGDVSFWEKI